MTGRRQPDEPAGQATDPVRDWITIWQSELAGLVADREVQEAMQVLIGQWAAMAERLLGAGSRDRPAGRAGAAPAPRPTPATAASDAGAVAGNGAEIERLAGRIAELEQRLAELERRAGSGGERRRPAARRARPRS